MILDNSIVLDGLLNNRTRNNRDNDLPILHSRNTLKIIRKFYSKLFAFLGIACHILTESSKDHLNTLVQELRILETTMSHLTEVPLKRSDIFRIEVITNGVDTLDIRLIESKLQIPVALIFIFSGLSISQDRSKDKITLEIFNLKCDLFIILILPRLENLGDSHQNTLHQRRHMILQPGEPEVCLAVLHEHGCETGFTNQVEHSISHCNLNLHRSISVVVCYYYCIFLLISLHLFNFVNIFDLYKQMD